MSERIYYKITNKELGSWIVEKEAYVQYKVGKYVTAPCWLAEQGYHLLVFDDIRYVKRVFCSFTDKLWECEIKDVQKYLPVCRDILLINKGILPKSNDTFPWIDGTTMVREVKLIKEIKV